MYIHTQEPVMVATATPNRLAPYLSEPQKPLPPLPTTPADRQAVLSDAVFAAVLALQGQLAHHDPAVVQKAAAMILDFEKTRLRHGRAVAGTVPASPLDPLPQLAPLPQLDPLPGCDARPRPADGPEVARALSAADAALDELDEFDELGEFDDPEYPELDAAGVGRVRAQLQAWADEQGTGKVVSWERAVWVAKQRSTAGDGSRVHKVRGETALITPSEPRAYTRTVLPPSSPFPPP